MIKITRRNISIENVIQSVKKKENGAIAVFIGIVRGDTHGQTVEHMELEAYEEMALRQLTTIKAETLGRYQVNDISIVHRIGVLAVSDTIVVIAVGAPHRDHAFQACRYVIDQLKVKVPLWKKESTLEGSHWVEGEKR
jgi:molybdopterin synthase catalytic subunit